MQNPVGERSPKGKAIQFEKSLGDALMEALADDVEINRKAEQMIKDIEIEMTPFLSWMESFPSKRSKVTIVEVEDDQT